MAHSSSLKTRLTIFSIGFYTAITPSTDKAERKLTPCSKAVYSAHWNLTASSVRSRYTHIYSEDFMSLRGRYAARTSALTNKIHDRETFMKGIDYSYYYEQEG